MAEMEKEVHVERILRRRAGTQIATQTDLSEKGETIASQINREIRTHLGGFDASEFPTYQTSDLQSLLRKTLNDTEKDFSFADTTFTPTTPAEPEKLPYDDAFANITHMPKEQFTAFYETPVVQKTVTRANTFGIKINLRGKLVLAVLSLTFLCLIFLAFFNAIAVNKAKIDIAKLDGSIAQQEILLNAALDAYHELTDEELLELKAQLAGYEAVDPGDVIKVDLVKESKPMDFNKKTNWFNDFCNWLTKVFGG